ncbi:hypothetical protein GO684_00140 [Wolbachia endosymbiont of Litomosoides brasiliensis]|uniref:hypothetical protein n=1 Tax=Wolbachia endosymbiont of Litomosoides brasiliensis TaxID=1812117 RepID=UPI001588D01D|nr:hypothetical protein [Wolbachia endosymbiont of Litomosoides brasiliensis]NUY39168.1 hypothetical protein [Wolbachia endosymbiont of Litomosoides brasiliensis]
MNKLFILSYVKIILSNLIRSTLHVLRLNYLAPKVKEDVLDEIQLGHLKVIDFRKNEIPLLWSEQLKKFYWSIEKAD